MLGIPDIHLRRATSADAEGVADVYVASWNEGFALLIVKGQWDFPVGGQ